MGVAYRSKTIPENLFLSTGLKVTREQVLATNQGQLYVHVRL